MHITDVAIITRELDIPEKSALLKLQAAGFVCSKQTCVMIQVPPHGQGQCRGGLCRVSDGTYVTGSGADINFELEAVSLSKSFLLHKPLVKHSVYLLAKFKAATVYYNPKPSETVQRAKPCKETILWLN